MNGLPDLPPKARDASKNKRLIVFLGSGISSAAGLPDWKRVRRRLATECSLPTDKEHLREIWKRDNDEYYEVFEEIRGESAESYAKIIKESLDIKQADLIKYLKWLKIIKSWQPVAIVTTNIDELLPNTGLYEKGQYRYQKDLYPQELREGKIFFLHGIGDQGIWSHGDVKDFYRHDDTKAFFWNMFGSYCVLFIGCSFKDRWKNLLEIKAPDISQCYHYALIPSQEHAERSTSRFFNNVEFLVYDNSTGYDNFGLTIEKWGTKPNLFENDIMINANRVGI